MEKKLQKRIKEGLGIEPNKQRFLRRLYKNYWYELVYSEVFNQWELNKETNDARKSLLKQVKWPRDVVKIVNITLVLEKYYNLPINKETLKIAMAIQKSWGEKYIEPYMSKKWNRICGIKKDMSKPIISITREQALKEQIARGFKTLKKFKRYNPEYRHCFSIIDRELVYPKNFGWGLKPKKIMVRDALTLVGVQGFTCITQ